MRTIIVRDAMRIPIGRQGENEAQRVVWPDIVTGWAKLYGDGVFSLAVKRKGDAAPYPVTVTTENGALVWVPTNADTAVAGSGSCELSYTVDDVLAKSQMWSTEVYPSLTGEGETEPPEPYQSWVDQVVAVGAAAQASADAAKADADRATALAAEVSQKAAQTAKDASDAAKAMEAAQTAQRLAEEAQGAAETAQRGAEAAKSAAEQSAQQAAESAAVYDNVVTDVTQTRRKLDYLWKLNNGISYQFEADNAEAYSKTVPSGAKVAVVESIGGHTEEINDVLVSAEVESIVLHGKNMWNDADAQFLNNYFSWSGDSWISNGTAGTFIWIDFLLDPGTYTISASVDRIENELLKMQFRDSSNTVLKELMGVYTAGRYELTYAVSERGTYKVLVGGYNQNGKITISNLQLEKNGKATKYSKYRVCTIAHIPDSVRTLPGYGWSAGDVWNAIERTETGWQYVQWVGSRAYQDGDAVTDGVTTYYVLDNPVITDITDLMADFPAYFEVEAGGIIAMENAAMLPVPSTEKYLIALAEVNG